MVHELVGGPELSTRYTDVPLISTTSVADADLILEVAYPIAPGARGALAMHAVLRFSPVFEYRWVDSGNYYAISNVEDFEFAPIRIVDSEHIAMMVERGKWRSQPAGERFGGRIDERELRHFRVAFDDFGALDIIALRAEIEHVELPLGGR